MNTGKANMVDNKIVDSKIAESGKAPGNVKSHRLRAIDWLRGLSVLFMIECHSLIFLDTQFEYSPIWLFLQNFNGLVSASFLLTAGFSGGLVGSRAAGDPAQRRRRATRTLLRICEILSISIYFHCALIPDLWNNFILLFRVDILMCIAIGAFCVWAILALCRGRNRIAFCILCIGAIMIFQLTSWAWNYHGSLLIEEIINNNSGATQFPIFPWLLFPLLGGAMGVIAAHPTKGRQRLAIFTATICLLIYLLVETRFGNYYWKFQPETVGNFWSRNALERAWKVGRIILVLLAFDGLGSYLSRFKSAAVAEKFMIPIQGILMFFSTRSLSAYFVHLSLLYGFMRLQFTNHWHHQFSFKGYAWRAVFIIILTACICQILHLLRRGLESVLRMTLTAIKSTAPATREA